DGVQVHSQSIWRTLDRWIRRAIVDLSLLRNEPDSGVDAWRRACVRMAPIRLDDGTVTDRFVGIMWHPDEFQRHTADTREARNNIEKSRRDQPLVRSVETSRQLHIAAMRGSDDS